MISDVMHDAVVAIREELENASRETKRYLKDPLYHRWYEGKLRQEIEDVVRRMDAIRAKLDAE